MMDAKLIRINSAFVQDHCNSIELKIILFFNMLKLYVMKKCIILLLAIFFLATCDSDDPVQFKLTTQAQPAEGGTVSPASGTFDEGEEVTLKATPADEYLFKNWSDDAVGNENPITIIMTDDKFITANFEKRTYPLSIQIQGEGTVTEEIVVAKSSTDYPSGTRVRLTAVPNEGWDFLRWSGAYSGTDNPIELTITEATQINVYFEPDDVEKTYVPDNQFEKALVDLGYDDFVDEYVLTENIRGIEILDISDRKIVDLTGLEDFEALNALDASNNNILSAEFYKNTKLAVLNLEGNDLARLDLSLMGCMFNVNVKENPLTCVQVNEEQLECMIPAEVYMKVETDAGVEISLDCGYGTEELTYVPDDNFERALIDMGYDDKMDDFVLTANISMVEELDLSGLEIHGLTGIEGFAALEALSCSDNLIKSLDMTRNVKLGMLKAENNEIRTVNLSQNTDLYALHLKGNLLSEINLSNTESLIYLDVSANVLEKLDVSAVNLWTLYATGNMLTCIRVNQVQLDDLDQFLSCNTPDYCWVVDPGVDFKLDCNP